MSETPRLLQLKNGHQKFLNSLKNKNERTTLKAEIFDHRHSEIAICHSDLITFRFCFLLTSSRKNNKTENSL